jgi:hypothetical protein
MTLGGFCLCSGLIKVKNQYYGDPEVSKMGVQQFESDFNQKSPMVMQRGEHIYLSTPFREESSPSGITW